MKEFKNGAISEEALDEVAGGLNVSPSMVKKALIAVGVGAYAMSKSRKGKKPVSPKQENDISKIDVDYFDGDEQWIADLNEYRPGSMNLRNLFKGED